MTDEDKKKISKKTSSVPLRKETVRVTLKSTPGEHAPGDKPSAPTPAPTIALKTPGVGGAPTSQTPTVKLQTGDAPPTPAPTIALQTGGGIKTPEPAPTVKLDTPGTSTPTGATSQPLPQATVQVQKSQPLATPAPTASPSQAPTLAASPAQVEAPDRSEGPASALSVIALVAALIVLGVQLGTANIWVNDETQENPGWGKLFE